MPVIPRLKGKYKSPERFNLSTEYYNNKRWKELRHSYIMRHPLCERCMQFGKVTAAEHVHHIKPFLRGRSQAERIRLLTDPNNLMSLCQTCHIIIHKELEEGV